MLHKYLVCAALVPSEMQMLLFSFDTYGLWALERLSDLSKVTHLISLRKSLLEVTVMVLSEMGFFFLIQILIQFMFAESVSGDRHGWFMPGLFYYLITIL